MSTVQERRKKVFVNRTLNAEYQIQLGWTSELIVPCLVKSRNRPCESGGGLWSIRDLDLTRSALSPVWTGRLSQQQPVGGGPGTC